MPSVRYPNPNKWLQPDVRDRVESIDKQTCEDWGGVWHDDCCYVRPLPLTTDHAPQTRVRSVDDAQAAFDHYTEFFEHVLDTFEPTSDSVVLVPCGAMKPIGSSAGHQKKLAALREAEFLPDCDLMIISEPCTVIPHDMRLTVPAVNYDFPPEFTEEDRAPQVFETFTDRLATWLDATQYDTIYPYLVQRHQNKFDAAVEKATHDPRVITVPGASANVDKLCDTGEAAYSGDQFKSTSDIATKLRFIRALKDHDNPDLVAEYPRPVYDFYANRSEYAPV